MNPLKKPEDIFSSDVIEQLNIALDEIGKIDPWFDDAVQCWVFEHPLYPESYGGETKEEVIAGYKLYLCEFINHRMADNIAPFVENQTSGRGGKRPGSGRPKGSTKGIPAVAVKIPTDIRDWIAEDRETRFDQIRELMKG